MTAPTSDAVIRAELILSATKLIELGCKVFPCGPDKAPLTRKGFKEATSDLGNIRRWLAKEPLPMLAMATGCVSGLFVLDLDVDAVKNLDGIKWWLENEKRYGLTTPHAIARTPRGGQHHYFKYPEDQIVGCSAGRLAPGVDVRGDGGYVIVPPSVSPVGKYLWDVSPWEVVNVD